MHTKQAAAAWRGLGDARPWESPTERAYRICGQCGLGHAEIATLLDTVGRVTLDAEDQVELWEQVAAPEAVELCRDCTEAIVGAGEAGAVSRR